MTVRAAAGRWLARLTRPVKLPVRLCHEATHIAAAAPWLEDWRLIVGPVDADAELAVDVAFADETPTWAVAIAFLAPMLLGLTGAATVGLSVLYGGLALPRTTFELALWSAAGLGWWLYTAPSFADVHGAIVELRGDPDE